MEYVDTTKNISAQVKYLYTNYQEILQYMTTIGKIKFDHEILVYLVKLNPGKCAQPEDAVIYLAKRECKITYHKFFQTITIYNIE